MNEDAGNFIKIFARSETLFIGSHSPTSTVAEALVPRYENLKKEGASEAFPAACNPR
jgi:hypothetical protein